MSAPVRLPSPPMTQRLVMPCSTRLRAARSRPARVVKALQRALPITVPPWRDKGGGDTARHADLGWEVGFGGLMAPGVILTSWMMLETLSQLACLMLSPPSTSPS